MVLAGLRPAAKGGMCAGVAAGQPRQHTSLLLSDPRAVREHIGRNIQLKKIKKPCNMRLSSLVRDPRDFEVIAIGGDKDFGMVATVGEDREHVTRGEVFALDGRSGVGEAFELRCRDRVEVNHAHVGESGTAPGVEGTNGGRNVYMPEDIRAAGDYGPLVEV